ncbi:MAG: hypothetical protein Q3963_03665 [Coriobacteriaceae bacterium]|nr:hypothetical protein [Coriobacteriaceae bacterium]
MHACGIDEAVFLASFNGAEARDALAQDEQMRRHLGIWQLPAFLVSSDAQSILLLGVPATGVLERVVQRLLA